MLTQYCQDNGLHIVGEYVDDGWSGTNYDRPQFLRMIDDIEDGKINCVITKDLSRLGRNYILTGQYTDIYFPAKGVRYIALNDGIDSEKGESEIAPFLNILNEMHARQTSKKVKAALHTRFQNGAHVGAYAPIGYRKDPAQKGHLIPDEETKWIVEKIFTLAAHGMGGAKIRKTLESERIPTPAWHNYLRDGTFAHIFEGQPEEKRYAWTTAQVKSILSDEVYLGHSVHNRQTNISFKNKKKVRKPKEEWFKVENTHEPLISHELWEQAQTHIASRKRPTADGETQIFAGLLKCADCGWGLRYMRNRATETRKERRLYTCTQYSEYGKDRCSIHYIRYETLYDIILQRLRHLKQQAEIDSDMMLARLIDSENRQRISDSKRQQKELARLTKRQKELDNLFAKLYEDSMKSEITERNYTMLMTKYEAEQTEVDDKINILTETLQKDTHTKNNAEKWLSLIRKYDNITELTAPLLNDLIEKIVVHEVTKDEDGNRVQEIEIFYRFVGKIE